LIAAQLSGSKNIRVAPSPQIGAGQLNATAAISDNDIWAVGFSPNTNAPPVVDSTLAEHFNGTSWSIVQTAAVSSRGSEFFGVAGAASNDVGAVGFQFGTQDPDFGIQLTERWDGTSWKLISSPNPGSQANGLFGVTALSDGTVAAVGFQRNEGFNAVPLIVPRGAA
jgi:hypothetical protein